MASSPQHEPTMEEILASIRKIISEDSTEPAPAPQAAPAPQPAVHVEAEADVLELTHEVEEMPAPAPAPIAPPPQPAPVFQAAPTPPPQPVHSPADDIVFQSIEETPVSSVARPASHSSDELVSDKARSAIDDALSGLDLGPEQHAAAAPVASVGGLSVEAVFERAIRESFDPVLTNWLHDQADLIVERMKPAIREWMEDNLPALLKTAVEAEVQRAVRARSRR